MTIESSEKTINNATAGGDDGYVRLHITPFDASLFNIVVPSAVAPQARNISYHTIETFPEKRYGFVELPQADADKIKKKLNGATLKGSKMKIEKARPEKSREPVEDDQPKSKSKRKDKSEKSDEAPKKRKRENGVVEGVTLGDRKVVRGWTDPLEYKKKPKKDKDGKTKEAPRKQPKSKYTDTPECLFKTRVPPNATANLPQADEETKRKKKKKGKSREVIVHEFEKTTKFPSFLKMAVPDKTGKDATDFVNGKGWVDEDGTVVEQVKEKVIPKPEKKNKKPPVKVVEESEDSDDTSSSGSSSSDDESDSDSDSDEEEQAEKAETKEKINGSNDARVPKAPEKPTEAKDDDSSDSDSSDSDSDSSSDSDDEAEAKPEKSSPAKSLTIDIPPPPTTPKAVHPLEALYKRNKDEAATTTDSGDAGGFSFFGADIEEEGEDGTDAAANVPMTPFTRQDFEWRNVRSAAPTPDSVHPSRKQPFWAQDQEDEMMEDVQEEDEEEATGAATSATSDFQKWFWENRGDLNRSWMTRRKTAAKEKRHRDNKARASKA
ncbi:hypothetical protein VHEMI06715 [[Torrubiella] hemipterigena]|uniref:RRM domain-containing protein n=1 Tax=[Torrubiella] hemipterigena TaxID=1531966 RepID=A0A0A1T1C6_9HYPO|nr:hypothetical protein VHEMI06715 [[Torrubiella] hemipterigena]